MLSLVVFVSLCFKYTLAQGSCGLPSYQDACDRTVEACVGRSTIRLLCSVDGTRFSNSGIQWFNVRDLNEDGTLSQPDQPASVTRQITVSAGDQGYWWCSVNSDTSDAQSCSSVPALHLYQCTCGDEDFQISSICPATPTRNACNVQPTLVCRSQTLLCLTTTQISMFPSQPSSTPAETANANLPPTPPAVAPTVEFPSPGRVFTTTLLLQPSHQTFVGHGTTRTNPVLLLPSVTQTPIEDGETRVDSVGGFSIVQLMLYIVGPVAALTAISIVLVLLVLVCCLHRCRKKRSKFGGQRQSNSRSCSVVASCAEEHIYDTVVFAKSSKSPVSPSHLYTPQPSLNAAEYEVPVTRHSLLTNGHHHQKQQEQKVDQEQQRRQEISDNQEQ